MWLGGKYTPLIQTAAVTVALIGAGLFVLMPISLIMKGVPFSMWVSAYGKVLSIFFVLGTLANFMAWLLCELFAFSMSRFVAAVIFSILCPVVFLILLGIAMYFQNGVFLEGSMSIEGQKNIGLIFGLLVPLCFGIYLGATKNA